MHHHLNSLPSVMRLLIKLAGEYGIPAIRNPVEKLSLNCAVLAVRLSVVLSGRKSRKSGILFPDQFAGIAITGKWRESAHALRRLLVDLRPGIAELMCHPGYVDHALRGISRLITERQDELSLLTSPALRSWIQEAGITLTTYRDIVQRRGSAESYE
jgi:chitin disaccharide deacetylase